MLWVAWRRRDLLHGYRYPAPLLVGGAAAWVWCPYLAHSAAGALGELF